MQAPPEATAARAAAREYTDFVLRFRNVLGTGVGRRTVGGSETDEWSLVVFVAHKIPPAFLRSDEMIPRELVTTQGRVGTDVVEVAPPRLLVDTAAYNPVVGGCQIRSVASGGTLGGAFYDARDYQPVLLTCNHCLTVPGQRTYIPNDPRVWQPAAAGAAEIGWTKRIVPMFPGPLGSPNAFEAVVDAGIVAPNLMTGVSFRVLEVGQHPYVVLPAYPGLDVVKRGATTDLTPGTVNHVDVAFVFTDSATGQRVRIGGADSVFSIKRIGGNFALPGDSGALVIDADGGAVRGMVFAGDLAVSGFTYACDIEAVMRSLELKTPCTGGLHALVYRAVVRRRPEIATDVLVAETADRFVKNVDKFRHRYLANTGDDRAASAIGRTLGLLATDLAEAVHEDEDFAGLLELAFGEWLVLPTVYDMLEYRLPREFGERVRAALDRMQHGRPDLAEPEWLAMALAAASGQKVRDLLNTATGFSSASVTSPQ
jgi:hypothetical protein